MSTQFLPSTVISLIGELLEIATTLGRLIKMIAKLEAELGKLQGVTISSRLSQTLTYHTSGGLPQDKVISQFHEQNRLYLEDIAKKFQLNEDLIVLKASLHERNSTLGIDLIQARLVCMKQLKTEYSSLRDSLTANRVETVPLEKLTPKHLLDKDAEARVASTKTGSSSSYGGSQVVNLSLKISLADIDEIERIIDDLNSAITEKEDERDAINTRSKVRVKLHPVTLKLLGLKPVIQKPSSVSSNIEINP
jgi:hypothetical protein